MIHLSFYVPKSHSEKVKKAAFGAGAGRMGNYDFCAFEVEGLGQFRPLEGSHPYLGKENEVEQVKEVKVEMICEDHLIEKVIEALKASHPYETPAYYAIKTLGY